MEGIFKSKAEVENGQYDALWSAYYITILSESKEELQTIETNVGVKGINCPIKLEVFNGNITILD